MCMAALHWARVDTVYYGATIEDADKAGFNELKLAAADVIRLGKSQIQLVDDILRDGIDSTLRGMGVASTADLYPGHVFVPPHFSPLTWP